MPERRTRRSGHGVVAKAALREARRILGPDADKFSIALKRYVDAVEVADAARREWELRGRPFSAPMGNGAEGVHPLIRTMENLDAKAARFGEVLGLDPASDKALRGKSGRGRPQGAASAQDRAAKPPPKVRLKVAG